MLWIWQLSHLGDSEARRYILGSKASHVVSHFLLVLPETGFAIKSSTAIHHRRNGWNSFCCSVCWRSSGVIDRTLYKQEEKVPKLIFIIFHQCTEHCSHFQLKMLQLKMKMTLPPSQGKWLYRDWWCSPPGLWGRWTCSPTSLSTARFASACPVHRWVFNFWFWFCDRSNLNMILKMLQFLLVQN